MLIKNAFQANCQIEYVVDIVMSMSDYRGKSILVTHLLTTTAHDS
jgi:hypothetical protein